MTQCQSCTAPADLYLCPRCIDDLSDMLSALVTGGATNDPHTGRTREIPGLLADLADAATGQTRFTGTTPRTRGDEAPIRFNDRARHIIKDLHKLLTFATCCITPTYTPTSPHDIAGHAQWLADHTTQLAHIDGAGKFHHALRDLTQRAHRCVDCPPSPRFCGQCDTLIDRKMCGLNLYAPRDAIEVTCPQCRTTHNIEKLYNRTLNSADHKTFTREALIGNQRTTNPALYGTGIMGAIGEFVHWQTFNRWLREKHIKPVMYLRPNGRRGFYRHSPNDTPEYRLADIRNTRRKMEQQQRTGKTKTG